MELAKPNIMKMKKHNKKRNRKTNWRIKNRTELWDKINKNEYRVHLKTKEINIKMKLWHFGKRWIMKMGFMIITTTHLLIGDQGMLI